MTSFIVTPVGSPMRTRHLGRIRRRQALPVQFCSIRVVATSLLVLVITTFLSSTTQASVHLPAKHPTSVDGTCELETKLRVSRGGGRHGRRGHGTNNNSATREGLKNSLASALATGCSKTLLAPLDTIKTIQQHYRSSGSSLSLAQTAKLVVSRPNGLRELYVSGLSGQCNAGCSFIC